MRSDRACLLCVLCLSGCTAAARPAARAPSAERTPTVAAAALSLPAVTTAGGEPPDLFVHCEDRTNCPDAVGMLVVDEGDDAEPERCTVTLIEGNRVLTASHCLPARFRRPGASCARTWVAFPETARSGAELIACDRVVAATPVVSDDALHQEHAVLQLTRASARRALTVDSAPMDPGSIVTVVSVTPHPVYGCTHALASRLCRVIDSKPAERALGHEAANVGWLANCPIARGNSGSPVLDYDGRIRAIVHGGTALTAGYGVTSVLPR